MTQVASNLVPYASCCISNVLMYGSGAADGLVRVQLTCSHLSFWTTDTEQNSPLLKEKDVKSSARPPAHVDPPTSSHMQTKLHNLCISA